MSQANPKSAVNALFPAPIKVGEGVIVYPLSLGHYALLEKTNSYLVSADHIPDTFEVVKTMYICTHSAKEVLDNFDRLQDTAFEWAERLPPYLTDVITRAIKEQIDAMMKVIPVAGNGDEGKKAETVS